MMAAASPSYHRKVSSSSLPSKQKDFILLSEFSELVGPIALVSDVLLMEYSQKILLDTLEIVSQQFYVCVLTVYYNQARECATIFYSCESH